MTLFVHITEKCQERAKKHSTLKDIEELKSRFEEAQAIDSAALEPRRDNLFVKSRYPRKAERLVIQQRNLDGDIVLVFVMIYSMADKKFQDFNANTDVALSYIDEKVLMEDITRQKEDIPVIKKEKLSEMERTILTKNPIDSLTDDYWIGETQDWIDYVKKLDDPTLAQINQDIQEILTSIDKDTIYKECANSTARLYYKKVGEKLLLLGYGTKKEEYDKLESDYEELLVLSKTEIDQEMILKKIKRLYDWETLADEEYKEIWFKLEKENLKGANLALSPEEHDVLQEISDSYHKNNVAFPLFISGRAGSGKSTMLQYLFADYIWYYLREQDGATQEGALPIYFATNQSLIKNSREVVFNIVKSKYLKNTKEKSSFTKFDVDEIVENSFKVLDDYLYSLLPDFAKQLFPLQHKIKYSDFKNIWHKKFNRIKNAMREYGPDISWYVIRTYIKGYSTDEILTPEGYDQINKNDKTVTRDQFELIYEKVYKDWYRRVDYQWDSQDLIRYLIENALIKSDFFAIFCDEAQDFTRIELELFFHLSSYLKKDLQNDQFKISKIPIAFAGDEFQTLNPTGFRWKQVKAMFVEKLLKKIYTNMNDQTNFSQFLNYKELQYNYRSDCEIVKLCNLIQLQRYVAFGSASSPQKYWGDNHGEVFRPAYYNLEKTREPLLDALRRNEELEIIIPVLLGEEDRYKKNDTFISEIAVALDIDTVSTRIYSPERIKGLERDQIVVYNFGEYAISQDLNLFENAEKDNIKLQFFMNQLYVAVSRARKKLFIIDTSRGIEQFWKKMISDKNIDNNFSKLDEKGKKSWNREFIGTLDFGQIPEITNELVDSLDAAESNEREGKLRKDPDLLLKSSFSYENASKNPKNKEKEKEYLKKSNMTKALAFYYSGKYLKAGHFYKKAAEFKMAITSYWQLEDKTGEKEIVKCVKSDPLLKYLLEVEIIEFNKRTRKEHKDYINIFAEIKRQSDNYLSRFVDEKSWSDILNKILVEILMKYSKNESNQWELLAKSYVAKLANSGIIFERSTLALLYYNANLYKKALEYYESENLRTKEYWNILYESAEMYPEQIEPLYHLKKYKELVVFYENNENIDLKQNIKNIIAKAFIELRQIKNAGRIWEKDGNVEEIWLFLKNNENTDDFFEISEVFIKLTLSFFPITAVNFVLGKSWEYEIIKNESEDTKDRKMINIADIDVANRGRLQEQFLAILKDDNNFKVPLNLYNEFLGVLKKATPLFYDASAQYFIEACKQNEYGELIQLFKRTQEKQIPRKLMHAVIKKLINFNYSFSQAYGAKIRFYISNYVSETSSISFKEKAILIEKFANTEATGFYDKIMGDAGCSKIERLFAEIRLAKSKLKYAKLLEDKGDSDKANNVLKTSESILKKYNICSENLESWRYPDNTISIEDELEKYGVRLEDFVEKNDNTSKKQLKKDLDSPSVPKEGENKPNQVAIAKEKPQLESSRKSGEKTEALKIAQTDDKNSKREKKMKTEFTVEGIKFNYLINKKRVNLENEESGDLASIKMMKNGEIKVASEDIDVLDRNKNQYYFKEWGLSITIKDKKNVTIFFDDIDGFMVNYSF